MTQDKKQVKMSFDEKRKAVLLAAKNESGEKIVTKQATFLNDDVPVFLEELRKFEKKSRSIRILAG